MENKQIQKAGDGSQQLQVVNPTINVGITEQRAREIFSEMNAIARQNYTQDAWELAMKRVGMFETLLMSKVEQIDGMLEAFRDPSFQFLLVEAQKRAAASDRKSDLEMLAELLAHRVEKSNERKTKASISKAVEIVDQIDDDALCGLTMVYAINSWCAVSGGISEGLNVMNELLSSLCYRELPHGFDWVYHLDILDAVRSSPVGTFKKFADYYTDIFNGYVCGGIQVESENHSKALGILKEANLPSTLLVPHELKDGFLRLNVRNKDSIADINIPLIPLNMGVERRNVTPHEVEALNQIWQLYSSDANQIGQIKSAFMEKWDSYNTLRLIRTWWEALPHSFRITPIGQVLAHANAQRYSKNVPDINA